jgi:hypothetical protein
LIVPHDKIRSISGEVNMGAVENVKEIADLIGKFHDIELNRRILKLEEEVIDLTRDKRRAEERAEELERILKFKGELVFKEPFYWLGADQTPYCPLCWEDKHKAIHIRYHNLLNGKQHWQCPNCKVSFTTQGIPGRY